VLPRQLITFRNAWHIDVKPNSYFNDEPVRFSQNDLEKCMPSLLQTLQLLVPVISTTFASVGNFFRYVKDHDSIGTLIIDEAGQATPQAAVGALWRAYRTIVIGDPKQIEPVVKDEAAVLRSAYGEDVMHCYSDKTLSVQSFADYLNSYGTRMYDSVDDEEGKWIGTPLKVHRRCISPMYEISNHISYSDTMKQVTPEPSEDVLESLSGVQTQWLNVSGAENGNKDHFVAEQGDKALEILDKAFEVFFRQETEAAETDDSASTETDRGPDLFIISPFNTVIEGMKQHIQNNLSNPAFPTLAAHPETVEKWLTSWKNVHIGTVHKFQGREANEVIFLLGCDHGSAKSANWVKKNIVNVAVTRAKYRLTIIGDGSVWKDCEPMMEAKRIIDTYALKQIQMLTKDPKDDSKLQNAASYIGRIPSSETVNIRRIESEYGNEETNNGVEETVEYVIDNEAVLEEYARSGLLTDLTDAQLIRFGFSSVEEFNALGDRICRNLRMGINLYDMIKPLQSFFEEEKFDVSFLAIPFCIAIEQTMQEFYFQGLKKHFPTVKVSTNGLHPIDEANQREVTLGSFEHVISSKKNRLGTIMVNGGEPSYNSDWWRKFANKLRKCKDYRNDCCHSELFGWDKLEGLKEVLFGNEEQGAQRDGLFKKTIVGEKLNALNG